jgi:hypothetical protein
MDQLRLPARGITQLPGKADCEDETVVVRAVERIRAPFIEG